MWMWIVSVCGMMKSCHVGKPCFPRSLSWLSIDGIPDLTSDGSQTLPCPTPRAILFAQNSRNLGRSTFSTWIPAQLTAVLRFHSRKPSFNVYCRRPNPHCRSKCCCCFCSLRRSARNSAATAKPHETKRFGVAMCER